MFNTNEPFEILILSGGEKKCSVNYPSDQQWIDLAGKKRSILRRNGRRVVGNWEDLGDHRRYDLELLNEIARDNSAAAFDEFEASKAVDRLARSEALAVDRDGDVFHVEMKVFGGASVTHTLRMPSQKQRSEHERATTPLKDSPKGTVMEISLKPSITLWGELGGTVEGYAEGSGVPCIHKTNAVAAVIQHLTELENADPEA